MTRRIVRTENAPSSANYSQAVIAGGLVFVSGQGPFEPTSGTVVGIRSRSRSDSASPTSPRSWPRREAHSIGSSARRSSSTTRTTSPVSMPSGSVTFRASDPPARAPICRSAG